MCLILQNDAVALTWRLNEYQQIGNHKPRLKIPANSAPDAACGASCTSGSDIDQEPGQRVGKILHAFDLRHTGIYINLESWSFSLTKRARMWSLTSYLPDGTVQKFILAGFVLVVISRVARYRHNLQVCQIQNRD